MKFLCIFSLWTISAVAGASPMTQAQFVEKFYRDYLSTLSKSPDQRIAPQFSKRMQEKIAANQSFCREKGGTDICGWNANGDVYLDAQEYDPKLTYKKAHVRTKVLSPGKIEVSLNVYPSLVDSKKFYDRKLVYTILRENNQWVVDNISTVHFEEETK